MALQLPNLDDRGYDGLVAEALALIPTLSPEWTNYNASDPGITLVELFAYLTDMLLYRLNRVTDDNTRKFIKLLQGPDWSESPNATLRDEIRVAVLNIRERYRAVTADDYRYLSTEGFNQWLITASQNSINFVARAHCVPQRNLDAGTEADRLKLRPEHVSVIIVPSDERPNLPSGTAKSTFPTRSPQPDPAQTSALFSFLDERRVLTTKLHVTGAFYAHIFVQLIIARNPDAVESDLTAAVNASLTSLLNPMASGDGAGWPFGRDVFVSDIYESLEKIPGIDFITDVSLKTSCEKGDDKCVLSDPIWHSSGELIGLKIQEHHLPVFDSATMVIAQSAAFVVVNLVVIAKGVPGSDNATLNREMKGVVSGIFHPASGGPGPATSQATDVFVSDLQVAILNLPGLLAPVSVTADCIPFDALQQDKNRGAFIHIEAGKVVDWRVSIQYSLA